MTRLIPTSLLVCTLLIGSGCQTLESLTALDSHQQPNCLLPASLLKDLVEEEQRFLTSDNTLRKQMLQDVKDKPARLVNLLSSITTDRSAKEQALSIYAQLPLLPNQSCSSDRYLYLRFRQAQANLQMLDELAALNRQLNAANTTISEQQRQIDALTQLEQAITRQREEH